MIRTTLFITILFSLIVGGCAGKDAVEAEPIASTVEVKDEAKARPVPKIEPVIVEQSPTDDSKEPDALAAPKAISAKGVVQPAPVAKKPAPIKKVKKSKKKRKTITNLAVRDGESLWSIAAKRSIYGDALLWPLLYQANRDQIKDPRQIFPGQELTVPRNKSRAELDEAREKARESTIFPLDILLKGRQ